MARNEIKLSDIVGDVLLLVDEDDHLKYSDKNKLMVLGRQALRELQYDAIRRIKSVRIEIDPATNSVSLPNDYIEYTKIGVLGDDGVVRVLGENTSLNISGDFTFDVNDEVILDSDGIEVLEDTPDSSGIQISNVNNLGEYIVFRNFYYNSSIGRLYGIGGGNNARGYFRIDKENDRIEVYAGVNGDKYIILEYVNDETMRQDPVVPMMAESAIRAYIYYRYIQRKVNVSLGEKQLAERDWYREKRKAKARSQKLTKSEIMSTIFKRFQLAPKTGGNL
jgi:hypothetical protein